MPPRAAKKRGGATAKKPAPRTRASARISKKQVVPLNVVEEENEVIEPETVTPVVESESNNEVDEKVLVEKELVAEEVPPVIDEDKIVVTEEVLVNTVEEVVEERNLETVVVEEERNVVEDIVEEKNVEETVVMVEETKVVEEIVEEKNLDAVVVVEEMKVVEESNSEMVVVEEKKVVEEIVKENILEMANPEVALEVEMDEKAVEEEPEEDPEEIEEDPEEVIEDENENSRGGDTVDGEKEIVIAVLKQELNEESAKAEIEYVIRGKDGHGATDLCEGGDLNEEPAKADVEDTIRGRDGHDATDSNEGGDLNEESAKAEVEDTIRGKDGHDTNDLNEGGDIEGESESGSDGEENEEDEDPSAYMHAPLTDRKKQKEFEIFVGGLDKGAVEEDLTEVFAKFGEIQSVRIVKHPTTQKSKGFAFIRYATVEQAKKVLEDLKDGTEVRGKRVGISPSQDSDTLYMGNICKTWTQDQVLEALKSLGIEEIEEIYLPNDPKNEEKNRGFALLEFRNHSDAMAAFQRLRKPDAVFGCDRSAKVAFAQSSIHPSEEALSQVKTVFVEGLTDSWSEERLREFCKQYGDVEKVQLSRDLVTTKRKDFGFISFTSRESAVACVEGFDNAEIAEGDAKVKANLAKPQYKGRLGKQAARGGYKVKTDGTTEAGPSKMKGQAKSNGSEVKGKYLQNLRSIKGGKPFKPQHRVSERQGGGSQSRSGRADYHRREPPGRGGRRGGRNMGAGFHGQPSTKPRDNMHGRPSRDFGPRNISSPFGNTRQSYGGPPAVYVDPYAQRYPTSAPAYRGHAYGPHSGSKRHNSEMEPHAGYIETSTVKQSRDRYGYEPRRGAAGYGGQGRGSTAYGGMAPSSSYAPTNSAYSGYETVGSGYAYPSSAASYAHPQSHSHLRPHSHPNPHTHQQPHPQPHPQPHLHPHAHQQPHLHHLPHQQPHLHPNPQQHPYPHPHPPPPPRQGYY